VSQGAARSCRAHDHPPHDGHVIEDIAGRAGAFRTARGHAASWVRRALSVSHGNVAGHRHRFLQAGLRARRLPRRRIHGGDPDTGASRSGRPCRPARSCGCRPRTADSARPDLRERLGLRIAAPRRRTPRSASCSPCNGRGQDMFSRPDHDAAALHRELQVPPPPGSSRPDDRPRRGELSALAFTALWHSCRRDVARETVLLHRRHGRARQRDRPVRSAPGARSSSSAAAGPTALTAGPRRSLVELISADLTDRAAVDRLRPRGRRRHPVANARSPGGRACSRSQRAVDRALDVNLRAPIILVLRRSPTSPWWPGERPHRLHVVAPRGKVATSTRPCTRPRKVRRCGRFSPGGWAGPAGFGRRLLRGHARAHSAMPACSMSPAVPRLLGSGTRTDRSTSATLVV